jgi:aminoglycoside phosphotransferase (APT) family kinase protein
MTDEVQSQSNFQAPDTVPVRDAHKLDGKALEEYLKKHLPNFKSLLSVSQFEGGQSNPTYLLESDEQRFVLRKKPPGELLASAHQVEREYRIMSALQKAEFPVPEVYLLCEDTSVIGTSFFIMNYVPGRVFRDPKLPQLEASERTAIYETLCDTAAQLHGLDWRRLGLGDFGKHQEYIARQISRWSIAYEATKSVEIPSMEKLMNWLSERIPDGDREGLDITIAHGDFRLENMIFHPTEPKILAVIDWELSTLGHPLGDIGYCNIPYHLPSNLAGLPGLNGLDLSQLGIPSEERFVERYAQKSKNEKARDLKSYKFFVAFSLFRLASIAQGIKRRAAQGIASSEKAEKVGALAKLFADTGWRLAQSV